MLNCTHFQVLNIHDFKWSVRFKLIYEPSHQVLRSFKHYCWELLCLQGLHVMTYMLSWPVTTTEKARELPLKVYLNNMRFIQCCFGAILFGCVQSLISLFLQTHTKYKVEQWCTFWVHHVHKPRPSAKLHTQNPIPAQTHTRTPSTLHRFILVPAKNWLSVINSSL